MSERVIFLWDEGFPTRVHLLAEATYRLTIKNIEAEAQSGYGFIWMKLLIDGEYYDWRECNGPEKLRVHFSGILKEAIDWYWSGNTLTWEFRLDQDYSREEVEVQLLEQYASFLGAAGILLTADLVPVIEWREDTL